MKKVFSILLMELFLIIALTGCGPNQEEIQNNFNDILDQPASEESISEASDYLDRYISKLDEDNASYMVYKLEHYILSFDNNGIDYSEWISRYDNHIDPVLTEFYKIMLEEQESPMKKDTVLTKSWAELALRTHDIEIFIKENRDFDLIREDLEWIYGYYMNAMIMGTNGTPVFDYKTNAFSEEAKTAYETFINKYPDSTTAWALKEYFRYLNSIKFKMDYNDKVSSKLFFDTCDWLVLESGKRVIQ